MQVRLFQGRNARRQIVHIEHEPVPSARFLPAAIGQRAVTRTLGTTEQKSEISLHNAGKRRPGLLFQCEPEMSGVESDGTLDVFDKITDSRHFVSSSVRLQFLQRRVREVAQQQRLMPGRDLRAGVSQTGEY